MVGIDNFDDYYSRRSKEDHLAAIPKKSRFRFVHADLLRTDLSSLIKPDSRVFHLAAQPGVRGSWGKRFDRYVRNNVSVTQRLLEFSSHRGIRRFVYASSSSVYGNPDSPPTSELTLPRPVSPYGVTKLCGEHLCDVYRKARGLPVVNLRFFTVYGPGQRPDMGFHLFLDAVARGRAITVFGKGDQLRDFTYIDDIVDGIVAAGERTTESTTFNLGGGMPTRLSDAFDTIARVTRLPVELEHVPPAEGDPHVTWADIRRASAELDFRPKIRLDEGLARQWAWQSERIGTRAGTRTTS